MAVTPLASAGRSGCWPFQSPSLGTGSWHAAGWRLLRYRSQGFSSWRAARMSSSPSSSQSGKLVRCEFALASLIPQAGLDEFSFRSSDLDSCSHTLHGSPLLEGAQLASNHAKPVHEHL